MSVVAQQFSSPRRLLGWLVGRGMARSNGEFSRWTVLQIQQHMKQPPRRIVEMGSGPGIGLEELLRRFPAAQVWGVDRSSVMLRQSRGRNRGAVEAGRLSLVCGEVSAVRHLAPLDLVAANHVLYFWREPQQVLTTVREGLGPGGMVALGYQFRQNMPPMAQKHFPREGFRLYDSEREIEAVPRTRRVRRRFALCEDGRRSSARAPQPGGNGLESSDRRRPIVKTDHTLSTSAIAAFKIAKRIRIARKALILKRRRPSGECNRTR